MAGASSSGGGGCSEGVGGASAGGGVVGAPQAPSKRIPITRIDNNVRFIYSSFPLLSCALRVSLHIYSSPFSSARNSANRSADRSCSLDSPSRAAFSLAKLSIAHPHNKLPENQPKSPPTTTPIRICTFAGIRLSSQATKDPISEPAITQPIKIAIAHLFFLGFFSLPFDRVPPLPLDHFTGTAHPLDFVMVCQVLAVTPPKRASSFASPTERIPLIMKMLVVAKCLVWVDTSFQI